jgi:hypothetical protein
MGHGWPQAAPHRAASLAIGLKRPMSSRAGSVTAASGDGDQDPHSVGGRRIKALCEKPSEGIKKP